MFHMGNKLCVKFDSSKIAIMGNNAFGEFDGLRISFTLYAC